MKTLAYLTLISLLLSLSSARIMFENPTHPKNDLVAEPIPVDERPLLPVDSSGRLLATATYPQVRIYPDYSLMTAGGTDLINYIQTQLMPPVISYFQAALKVKQPLTSPLKIPTGYSGICGYNSVPSALAKGVNADFYLIVNTKSDQAANWVANAGACYTSSTTNRPIIARMLFNLIYTKAAVGDVIAHETNMYLTIHEMLHAFGFTGANFPNFIDASGNKLTNTIKTLTSNGVTRTYLNVEPLTTNVRKYFGCNSLPGALLENDGGTGTAGDHFERKAFLYEVMTSGVVIGYRVSSFSFNVLEGSGWYVPDYSYAEPFYFGQGQGCDFLYQVCSANNNPFTSEYCQSNGPTRGCTPSGRGGGICAADSRSDGCYYYFPTDDYDCQDSSSAANARLPKQETYGRAAGSKCFEGTLTSLAKASQTSYCFTYTCSGSGLSTQLTVNVGSTSVKCTKAGSMSVTGLNGVLTCPDPLSFCNNDGKKYCPRNCMGRGTCVNNVCQCNQGSSGIDCGIVGANWSG